MKKFLVAIASLAMLMGLVSCDLLGPVEFSEQALVIKNSNTSKTAYWIDSYKIESGEDIISVAQNKSSSDKGDWTLTITSLKEGTAKITLYSEECAKIAKNVTVEVSASGSIFGQINKLHRFTYYTVGSSYNLESPWKDNPASIDPVIDKGSYRYDSDSNFSISVNGDIIYLYHYKENNIYTWIRGVIVQGTTGVIEQIDWDTCGKYQKSPEFWYNEILYDDDKKSYYPIISGLTYNDLYYSVSFDHKQITIGNLDFTK